MKLNIELRPHVGLTNTELGKIETRLDQDMVLVSTDEQPKPAFIGYLPHREGAAFLPCVPFLRFPRDLQTAIVLEIAKAKGSPVPCGVLPASPTAWEAVDETDDEGADE